MKIEDVVREMIGPTGGAIDMNLTYDARVQLSDRLLSHGIIVTEDNIETVVIEVLQTLLDAGIFVDR